MALTTERRPDLARTTLSVLFIGGLLAGSLWILSPFLAAFIWAIMIVVATWPLLLRLEGFFGGRRGPAVAVMPLAGDRLQATWNEFAGAGCPT